MRLAFDDQIFLSQAYGGISRYFTRLIEEIVLRNHDVRIFAPFHRNLYLKALPREVINGRFCTPFRKTNRLLRYYNSVIGGMQTRAWEPDILHETYYTKNRIFPVSGPTVITVHDMIHELFPNMFPPRDRTSAIKRSAIERADHVICISENTRCDLIRLFGVPESKTSVVHHGFDRFITNDRSALTLLCKIKRPYILYVGARAGYKNFYSFAKAYSQSNSLLKDFDIVAFGGSHFSADEHSFFKELALDPKRVHQVGGDDGVLGTLYANARAFVYPSFYEGFGLPPLEAMANKCPVVSSNTSSMPEVIGEAAAYFNPYNTDEMLAAIESVVYDEDRRSDLIRKGEERLHLFSWKRCAEETLIVYQAVLQG